MEMSLVIRCRMLMQEVSTTVSRILRFIIEFKAVQDNLTSTKVWEGGYV
jgi:hypothetical protein